jgi:hypothetical protein
LEGRERGAGARDDGFSILVAEFVRRFQTLTQSYAAMPRARLCVGVSALPRTETTVPELGVGLLFSITSNLRR